MFSRRNVKLDKVLLLKAERRAQELGFESTDEYVAHVVELDMETSFDDVGDQAVLHQLRGLGYIS